MGAPSTISVPPLVLRIVHIFKGEDSNIGIDGARGASRHLFVYVTCVWFLWNKVEKIINYAYHILCRNMLVFACSIIATSQCWLFAFRANTGQISVFTFKYPYLPSYVRICPRIQLPVSAQWSERLAYILCCQSTRKDDA